MLVAIQTTCDKAEVLREISQHLVEKKLAACCQISGPIESHYQWQGKLETSQEFVCTIKTVRENYRRVEQAIREIHTYDVPQIIFFEIAGSKPYSEWVSGCVSSD